MYIFKLFSRLVVVRKRLIVFAVTLLIFNLVVSMTYFYLGRMPGDTIDHRLAESTIPETAERPRPPARNCTTVGIPPRIVCEVGRTIDESLQIRDLLPSLADGRFIYNRLTTMWRDVPETVALKLSLASEPEPTIPRTLRGERATGETPITPEMSIEMHGTAGLEVKPLRPVRQRISDLASTTWEWEIIPKLEGEQVLSLTVFIHIDNDGPFTLKTFENIIYVQVTAWQKTNDVISMVNPLWVFLAGAIPVIWGAYAWIRGASSKLHDKTELAPASERLRSTSRKESISRNKRPKRQIVDKEANTRVSSQRTLTDSQN